MRTTMWSYASYISACANRKLSFRQKKAINIEMTEVVLLVDHQLCLPKLLDAPPSTFLAFLYLISYQLVF